MGLRLLGFVYEYIKLGLLCLLLPFVLSLLVVRFISVFFFCTILVRDHCQTLSSVCSWRKGIDGAGTTSDSVPIFFEPIDFTFHEQAFYLVSWKCGSGKSSLFQMIAQSRPLPYSGSSTDRWERSQSAFYHRTCPNGWHSLSKSLIINLPWRVCLRS